MEREWVWAGRQDGCGELRARASGTLRDEWGADVHTCGGPPGRSGAVGLAPSSHARSCRTSKGRTAFCLRTSGFAPGAL